MCGNCGKDVDEDVALALMLQGETRVFAFCFLCVSLTFLPMKLGGAYGFIQGSLLI